MKVTKEIYKAYLEEQLNEISSINDEDFEEISLEEGLHIIDIRNYIMKELYLLDNNGGF